MSALLSLSSFELPRLVIHIDITALLSIIIAVFVKPRFGIVFACVLEFLVLSCIASVVLEKYLGFYEEKMSKTR